jgi:hypothetical protein
LEGIIKLIKEKKESLENNSRKFSVWVTGLETGLEADNPSSFKSNLFFELFVQEKLGPSSRLLQEAHQTQHTRGKANRWNRMTGSLFRYAIHAESSSLAYGYDAVLSIRIL